MTLDAQHAGEIQGVADARAHGIDAGGRGRHHHDAVEIVVVVLFFLAVMTGARRQVVFRGGAQPDQHRRRQLAPGAHDVDAGPQHGFETRLDPRQDRRRNQIALRQHHQIGAGELVLEHFLDRIVVIERIIGGPLRGNSILIDRDAAFGQRQRIHHGDDAVDRGAGAHRRPVERLQQRLRQAPGRRSR